MTDPGRDLKQRREADGVKLALVRTELANRRTLLAYVKTALGILAGGVALIHITGIPPAMVTFGWTLLPVSALAMAAGLRDYLKTRAIIQDNKKDSQV